MKRLMCMFSLAFLGFVFFACKVESDDVIVVEPPVFKTDLSSEETTYNLNQDSSRLTVEVIAPTNSDSIKYEWYKGKCAGGVCTPEKVNQFSDWIKPDTSEVGDYEYYVLVKNVFRGVESKAIRSKHALIKVIDSGSVVNPEVPVFSVNLTADSVTYVKDSPAAALSVTATVSDGGVVSYQWYKDGVEIPEETNSSYTPSTAALGSATYYCVATNTLNSKTATAHSASKVVIVNDPALTNAASPVITVQPAGATYNEGASIAALSVTANSSDGGVISYQWYKDGVEIPSATNPSYTPTVGGTYTVKVSNYLASATGNKVAFLMSANAVIKINVLANPVSPVFTLNLTAGSVSYTKNAPAAALSVTATVSDGGVVSYQWYKDGTKITGEINSSYTPSTAVVGTATYYCIATNTLNSKTATKQSNTVSITVSANSGGGTGSGGISFQF